MTKQHQPDERPDTAGSDHPLQPCDGSSRRAMRRRLLQASLGAPMIYTLPHATLAAGSTCVGKPGNVLGPDEIPLESEEIATQESLGDWDASGADRRRGLRNDWAEGVQVQESGERSIAEGDQAHLDGTDYVFHDGQWYAESCAASLGIGVAAAEVFQMDRIR